MMTTRQIERLWTAKQFGKLSEALLAGRQEGAFALEGTCQPCFVAALAMIRMDELSQSHLPLFSRLLKVVLAAQDRDGGFIDPATTALCLRALLIDQGGGQAIDAAFSYLANLQREEGIWPGGPLRRMPADLAASLFILYQLGTDGRFRSAVHFDMALEWFDRNESTLSPKCRGMYQWTRRRWASPVAVREERSSTTLFAA